MGGVVTYLCDCQKSLFAVKNDSPSDATQEKTGDDKADTQDSETRTKSDENQNTEKGPQSVDQSESSEPPKTYLPVNRNMYNEDTSTVLPCLHVMLGSATGYMRVRIGDSREFQCSMN